MRELIRSRPSDERGAVLMLVGVAAMVLLAVTTLVIDMGHNLSEARRLQRATDAAALAAAQSYAVGDQGCDAVAADFLGRNIAEAVMVKCEAHGDTANGTFGWVIVDGSLVVDQFLAGIIGIHQVDLERRSVGVFGATSGRWRGGLRPMALCGVSLMNRPEFTDWQQAGATTVSDPIRVAYSKDHPNDCGESTGSWGFVDFDGGANANDDANEWIEHGYPGTVTTGWYPSDTGAFSTSNSNALDTLIESGEQFWLPVFTDATGEGSNSEFEISTYLAVRLVDYRATGGQEHRYIEFIIDPIGLDASCCAPPNPDGFDTGSRHTGLFALGPDGNPLGVTS